MHDLLIKENEYRINHGVDSHLRDEPSIWGFYKVRKNGNDFILTFPR